MNELCGYNAYVTALKYGTGTIAVMAISPRISILVYSCYV